MQEDSAARGLLDAFKHEVGEHSRLFEVHDGLMRILGAVLAVFLAAIWTSELPIDMLTWLTLVGIWVFATLLACVTSYVHVSYLHEHGQAMFSFVRRGVSWELIVSGLLGATVVFTGLRFLVENAVASPAAIATGITVLAAVVTLLIVPVTPLLANMRAIAFLKTSLELVLDANGKPTGNSRIKVCPADAFAPSQSDQAELLRRLDAAFSVLNQRESLADNT
jgi:hypothetical protein